SVFYSSSGCLSSGTHPFAAPCQPFFYATADTQPGLIQASGSIGTTPLDPGGSLSLLQFSSGLQVEQITAIQGFSQTSAASAQTGGGSASVIGPVNITSGADTDPAQPGHDYDSRTSTSALTGGPLSLTGDG